METQRENEILGVLGAKLKNRNLVLMATGFSLKMEVRFKNDIIKTALEKNKPSSHREQEVCME